MKNYFADLFDRWVCSLLTPIEKTVFFIAVLILFSGIYTATFLLAGVLGITGFVAVSAGLLAANLGSIAILFAIDRAVRN